jgi:hypothetical protein
MPHLTFAMHACGEGLNKGWLQRGDIAAVQVVELTAGLRACGFQATCRRTIIGNARRSGAQNRNVMPTWLGWNPSRL